jgi:hypothetical protein
LHSRRGLHLLSSNMLRGKPMASSERSGAGEALHAWVVDHDESRLFLVLYISLALVLSIVLGLFWLVALALVHLLFEFVRCRHHGLRGHTAIGSAIWGVRLDLALVLFAFVLTIYLTFVFGVLGLHAVGRAGSAAAAGVRGGAQFAAWERVIRGLLLSIDDGLQGLRAVYAVRTEPAALGSRSFEAEGQVTVTRAPMGIGDGLTILLAGVCILLIAAAPWITQEGWPLLASRLAAELHPFPTR